MDDATATHDDLSRTIMKTQATRVAEAAEMLKNGWQPYKM
jgi:hypothetical protein